MRDIINYTEQYMKPNFEDYQIIYRRKKIIEILSKYSHKKILEIGCGMEPLFKYINDYEEYVVVEPSYEFFKNALKESKENVVCKNEYFKYSDELKNMKFDYIVCSSLLHELEKPQEMIRDMYHICKEDTIVHINVPNAESFHRLLAVESKIIPATDFFSERNILFQQNTVFSLKQLKKLVEINGFEVIDEGTYFIKPFSHDQMYKLLEEKIITEDVLDGLYNMEKYLPKLGSELYVNVKKRK